jgi:uncharacterized surface protein with fasciclin (FAS1) repeats
MKRYFSFNRLLTLLLLLTGTACMFTACNSDDVGGNLYTFTDQTMGQYFEKDSTKTLTEFRRLLDTTDVMGLLKTYGEYTCFAPTDSAMRAFYHEHNKSGLCDYTMDSLQLMAFDHLINGTILMNSQFIKGNQGPVSMSDRYFKISFDSIGNGTRVNDSSYIIKKDITVHNGVIHKINKVLNPTREGIAALVTKDKKFSIFVDALNATGLIDSLRLIKDETYDANKYDQSVLVPKAKGDWFYQEYPANRKYGYTVFMESNTTMEAHDIHNLESLKLYAKSVYDEVYPQDASITDLTDRKNSLNRFVAYHMVNKQLNLSKIIDAYDTDHMIKTRDMYEYIETMCPNTLIEVTKVRTSNKTNLLNIHVSSEDNLSKMVQITSYNDKTAVNGVYHEVNDMLVYSYDVANMMATKRLRFEAAGFFPELTNNNLRGRGNTLPNLQFKLPRGYIDRISCSEQTTVNYLTPYYKYQDYEGDELFLSSTIGKLYDFSIVTPPVPAGTYEVRFGYLTNGKRGVAQLYFDGVPAGVPLNLNTAATASSIGYVAPGKDPDDPFGYQNDKMMRNRGYMKGPACFKVPTTGWSDGENARMSPQLLRKILGTYTFKTPGNHVLMVKGLSGGEFMMDYLDFVPTSVLENEDIY